MRFLVRTLARVDPIVVHVQRFGQQIDRGLEVLETDSTRYPGRVPRFVHLNLARFFMVTERAIELRVQRLNGFLFTRRLPLALPASHYVLTVSFPRVLLLKDASQVGLGHPDFFDYLRSKLLGTTQLRQAVLG